MRRTVLSLAVVLLASLPAYGDGMPPDRETKGLLHRHPGLTMSMEHGVRVWRPVSRVYAAYGGGAAAGADPYYGYGPDTNGYGRYGGFGGWGYPYDGYGANRNQNKDHGRNYGFGYQTSHGVTIYRPQLPRYAMAPVSPGYGGVSHGHLPMAVHINVGPMAHGTPHGGPGMYGTGGGHMPAGHASMGGGHMMGGHASGGHGHR